MYSLFAFAKAGCTLDVIQFLFWALVTFYLMLHNWIIVLETSVEHVILYLTDLNCGRLLLTLKLCLDFVSSKFFVYFLFFSAKHP